MKSALIIGISGFVGGYLAEELMEHNIKVFGAATRERNANEKVSFKRIDLIDKNSIITVLDDIRPDYIINLAAISSVRVSWDIPDITFDVNVKGTINLLEAIKKLKLKSRVLLVGSSEQYGKIKGTDRIDENYPLNALNPYGISKIMQERIALMYKVTYGIDIILVRAFNHTGPKQGLGFAIPDFAKQIAEIEILNKESVIYVGNLKAERDISDVRDIVKGYYALLMRGKSGEVYNIGSGKSYSIDFLLQVLLKESFKKITIKVAPSKFRPNDVPVIVCNNMKIWSHTSWEPKIEIRKTLKDILQYWREMFQNNK